MKATRAFVVGISRYQLPGWDTDGPVRNAFAIVKWLIQNDVPADRIHLFLDNETLTEVEKTWLQSKQVAIRNTSFQEINRFWRQELSAAGQPGDDLFVFWSGHGVTDSSDRRLFFCSDFATTLTTSVFNATEFIANLRSANYDTFKKQIVLADVCGTYAEFRTSPTDDKPVDMHATQQLTVFASPDGEYTRDPDGFGAFTGALLQTLSGFDHRWPERDEFLKGLDSVVQGWEQKPFRISWRGTNQQENELRAGQHRTSRNEYATSILSLLSTYPLAGADLRRPFELTAANLGNSSLSSAHSLAGMIDELAELQGDQLGGASFGLIQFLTRLARNPNLPQERASAIEKWISANSAEQTLAEVRATLEIEQQDLLLLLRIDHDSAGEISGFQAFLRYADLTPVRGFESELCKVENWSDLGAAIRKLIEEKLVDQNQQDLQIHFLVDPPLFDLPFHQLELKAGDQLGEQHVCVVHYRTRALGPRTSLTSRWREWLRKLDDAAIANAPLLEISMSSGVLPPAKGICYASFAVGPNAKGLPEKQKLQRILTLGAPYLCWSLSDGYLQNSVLQKTLSELFCQAGRFTLVPTKLLAERIRNCPVAGQLTLLWDDPLFEPFSKTAGIQQ